MKSCVLTVAVATSGGALVACGAGSISPAGQGGNSTGSAGSPGVTGGPSGVGGANTSGPTGASSGSGGFTTGAAGRSAGGAGGGSAGSGVVDGGGGSGPVIEPADRGATVPYLEYEAEDADTNGMLIGPSRTMFEIPAEASQRRAVRLETTGQYVRFVNTRLANSIVVRYVIPDSADGAGTNATLSVYVDGTMRQKLSVTSRYAWTYGAFGNARPNDPAQGQPHHFFDEAHALIGDIPAGAIVSLQKDASDTAVYYIVDLIDLEYVGPPLAQPANSISITDCGATPDDDTDDQPAIQRCIDNARTQARVLFIPAGTFRVLARALTVDNVTIRGAGMWYSTMSGVNAHFDCYGNACKYYDLAVFGDTILRDDTSLESTFSGSSGNGTLLENIWAEHSKTGYWVGPNATALTIRKSRFRNLYADGVNLWQNTSNSVVEHTHFRNTGDDALAMWSPSTAAPDTNNVFRFNTVQVPWVANCFGIYGGQDNSLEDNVCADVVTYPGILIAQQFDSQPFQGTTKVLRNTLVRAGNDGQGALKIYAAQGPIGGFLVQDTLIKDPTFSGLQIQGPSRIDNLRFERVQITGAGTFGIQANVDANGTAVANTVTVTNGGLNDLSRGAFGWVREAGNAGW